MNCEAMVLLDYERSFLRSGLDYFRIILYIIK